MTGDETEAEPDQESEPEREYMVALAALHAFQKLGRPFEVEYRDDDTFLAFVVAIGEDFVLLSNVHQVSWQNGFTAMPLRLINRVLPTSDADFILRAQEALQHEVPLHFPFAPSTMEELVTNVCNYFPIVVLNTDLEDSGPSAGVAGTVQNISNGIIELRTISIGGHWMDEPHRVRVDEIEMVLFGSKYETTLQLIGELPD